MASEKLSRPWLKTIEVLSGEVSHLEAEVTEYVNPEKPTHDDSPVYYTRIYHAKFKLDHRLMEAEFSKPVVIQNGNRLTVSGYSKGPQFQVLAYRNQSNGNGYAENGLALALGGIFFLSIALYLFNSVWITDKPTLAMIMLISFVGLGAYMIYKAFLIRQAALLLNAIQ